MDTSKFYLIKLNDSEFFITNMGAYQQVKGWELIVERIKTLVKDPKKITFTIKELATNSAGYVKILEAQ